MKKIRFMLAMALILQSVSILKAQQVLSGQSQKSMSSYDSLMISKLPPLRLSDEASRRFIPAIVDNSTLPFFRPIFCQEGYECGQAASIGYDFTYEINCLRGLPANVPENQYATFFAYNFINGGADQTGVSFYETYEILNYAGCPTVSDYGGMSNGGFTAWMSGYNLYYNAMHNRLSDVYSIKVNTAEGIQTLKNWIYDHGNGSAAGGIGCFYSEIQFNASVFPPNVPEAGKQVITWWGNSPNHAMTIVGYNDSIRWDYNKDGLYTNNIDLNGDNIIDPRDWEIGGFKMANSYGDQYWGNEGFCYITYKSVADNYGSHGIWNNTVVVIDVRENYEPQLTAKVNLTYGCRNKLRIMAGISNNPAATEPDYIQHFPVFDFQGGCHPMRGEDASDSIEIGLDLNPLLQYVQPGESAKYFLIVQENDPSNEFEGVINGFSIIDYTNGINEVVSNFSDIPIANNELTSLSVSTTVNYNPVEITTSTLPETVLYEDFTYDLQAQGGNPPYRWHLADDYLVSDSSVSMPMIDSIKLQPTSLYNGKTEVNLPFNFPFYGKEYNKVYATVDGYLMFHDSEVPWPYYIEGRTYFIETPLIAPSLCIPFIISEGSSGIWYEETDDAVYFRWRLNVYGSTAIYNAVVKLYSDGRIEMNYGESNVPSWVKRFAGISNGDGENYKLLSYDDNFSANPGRLVCFTPSNMYYGLELSNTGTLSGHCEYPMQNTPVTVCVSDGNNIRDYQILYLTTKGLELDYELLAGNDNRIEFGETVALNMKLVNHNNYPLGLTNLMLSSNDPYYSLIDSTETINNIMSGDTMVISGAFTIEVHQNIPDRYESVWTINSSNPNEQWHRNIKVTGFRPEIQIKSITFTDDNNNIPEPGEDIRLFVTIKNTGGARLVNSESVITSDDEYITIMSGTGFNDSLAPFETFDMVFDLRLSPQTPMGHEINLNLNISGDNGFANTTVITLRAGIVTENFETNNLSDLGWVTSTDNPWYIEEGNAYEGNYCARSAIIGDNQSSYLRIYWNSTSADSISFWLNIDCDNFDYLLFNTKYGEQGRWSGKTGWFRVVDPVPAGENFFKWTYEKNYTESFGEDCARLDYIVFPQLNGTIPANQLPDGIEKLILYPNPSSECLNITYSVVNSGPLSISIVDNQGKRLYFYEDLMAIPGEYSLKPNIGTLKPGIYIVEMKTNETTIIRKMCKF